MCQLEPLLGAESCIVLRKTKGQQGQKDKRLLPPAIRCASVRRHQKGLEIRCSIRLSYGPIERAYSPHGLRR